MTKHLCDSSVWLALALTGHRHHTHAREWLDTLDEPASAMFCRVSQQTLLRLLTTAAVLAPYRTEPLTNDEAWTVYEALVSDDRIAFGTEPAGLASSWKEFTRRDTASPKLWMDAYLAAFALAARWTMVTTDTAFRQFSGLDLLLLG